MEVRQKRQKKRRPQKEETAQDARKSMHNQKRSRLVHEETTSADPQKPPPRDDCTLRGALPEGADAAAIEALLERRMEAKRSKDYTTADMLQRDLVAQGVDLNDQERWWRRRSSETRISTSTTSRSSNG